jgi:hypothetical protein
MHSRSDAEGNWLFPAGLVLQEISQQDQDVFRRSIFSASGTEFSGYVELTQRAYISVWCEFRGMEPIINFFSDLDPEIAFRAFLLQERPTQDRLNKELNRILDARQADSLGTSGARFEAVFPTPLQAVSGAIQPFLAGLSPRNARGVEERIMNKWQDRIALDSEQYGSGEGITDIFQEFRDGGFIE